jgi:translation elongation factor EF-1beta
LQTNIEDLEERLREKERENATVAQSLERERKERALRTVPSLHSIQGDDAEEETFSDIYATITQKEGEINILQRELSDLKEEIDSIKIVNANRLEAMEAEQADYIQTIIEMKMRCAESEMRASEKEFMYSQLKKKMGR